MSTLPRSFLLLCLVLLGFANAQTTNPPLYCSVFSLQPFTAVNSGTIFSMGDALSPAINTVYGTVYYYSTFNVAVTNNHVILNLNPSSVGNISFSVAYGLFSSTNGLILANRYITDSSGLAKVFNYNPSGNQVDLTPFAVSQAQRLTYVITVNLTQFIYGPTGLDGSIARTDGCAYTDYFFLTNLEGIPGNNSGLGPGSSSSTGSTGVLGDPQFVGLRGQSFQVHGIDGAIYNLISDHDLQVNSRFTFLNGPRECPILPSTGKKSIACWSHPGSYLSEVGLKTSAGDRLLITAGNAKTGFLSIKLNEEEMLIGATEELHHDDDSSIGFATYNNTHEMVASAGQFVITIENVDGFLNLRSVYVHDWRRLSSHGLLGQTWRAKRYSGKVKEIEGEVDDYVILSDDIFGDNFMFNKHNLETTA